VIRGGNGSPSTTELLLKTLRQTGHKLNIALRCDSPDAIRSAVRNRIGLGILYHDQAASGMRAGEFKEIRVQNLKLEGTIYIVYQKGKSLSVHGNEILTLLRDYRQRKVSRSKQSKEI
jgi:DNA-binding transcriptional LysR family regulator